jgi:putative pyruvate formate lyase activating enzyme
MPGALEETRAILEWIARELGPRTYVNLMNQYRPAGKVTADRFSAIDRSPGVAELESAYDIAAELGLQRLDRRIGKRGSRPRPL